MKKSTIIMEIMLTFSVFSLKANDNCGQENNVFMAGENVSYKIYYNWKSVWMGAGTVDFSVNAVEAGGREMYHLKAEGKTYKRYNWFYKVNDVYESFVDPATLMPYQFKRDVYEGGFTIYNEYLFNREENQIISLHEDSKTALKKSKHDVTSCTMDILSAIYYTRVMDFSGNSMNDTIPISVFLDEKVYDIYVRYLGKERLNIGEAEFECIKFSPLLLEGSVFKGGEGMTIWVTDDKNRIPVMIETPIIVGSIKAILDDYTGLRHQLTAKVN